MQRLRRVQPQALALSNGIIRQPAMTTEHLAFLIVDWTGTRDLDHAPARCADRHRRALLLQQRGVAIDKAAIIVLRHKTDLLALWLARHAQTSLRSHCTHLRLGILAQGKAGVRKLLLVEHMQHIRLILPAIDAPAQTPLARQRMVIHAHIVSRRQVIGIEGERALEQDRKADMAITGQTGIGRASRYILLVKEIYHMLFKLLLDIYQVERNV